jgi:hypothetical protein
MTLEQYIDQINKRYQLGNATEHTFRGDLQQLIETLVPTIMATNEPKRQSCGAPDYILTKKDKSDKNSSVPVGYIEAKDIGDSDMLGEKKSGNKEQFDRYKASLSNIIFTDYLTFHFYQNAKLIKSISIATIEKNKIIAQPQHFAEFTLYIQNFCTFVSQTITQSQVLATLMATKSRLFANAIEQAIQQDIDQEQNTQLTGIYKAFQVALIQDIDVKQFSDLFAQTVTYGFFAARYRDYTLQDFSREEASRLIPLSNPFLRKLFLFISSIDLDERILWIVEDLVSIFLACNLRDILKTYGKSTKMENPIIHFYEDFLAEYDPKLRKARGVWYTPQPVVNFIVRAVDDVLKTEFDLPQGLADTSKTKITTPNLSKGGETTREVHKVQILDPATGTGTFLAEVVKHIHKKFEGQKGIWNSYVEQHLIPRLNGFELLMASYAMAHLQLDILLSELSSPNPEEIEMRKSEQRFNIFLTNSLEAPKLEQPDLFTAPFITDEALQADKVKRDTPVMCIIGNPPYSGISSNNGKWISDLIEDYKYIDGVHFNERKHWLNDDYVKFLRYGQHFIEKNGSGVLAFINPHGFLDNPTFRGMRWNLLKTYDKIYTIDLHGNSKKKETAPDGSADANVFYIMQGVSINIFIKTGKKKPKELGKIFHFDLLGKREMKYDFLSENSLSSTDFKEIKPENPSYFFVPKNTESLSGYENGFLTSDLFISQSMGITSARDSFVVDFEKKYLESRIRDFCNREIEHNNFQAKYKLNENYQWKVAEQRSIVPDYSENYIKPISYRPFDTRYIYFQENLVFRMRGEIMNNFNKGNIAFCAVKLGRNADYHNYFLTNNVTDKGISSSLDNANIFPLYLYPNNTGQQTIGQNTERTPNLNAAIVQQLAEKVGLTFTNEKEETTNTFAPIDLLDYIYAVLYSPTYREKYKEFLKIDFPRVPFPKDKDIFWKLVKLGREIREIHLLESPQVEKNITQYSIDGDNVVGKIKFQDNKVYINETQYFDNVPEVAWNFYIGGYQPAQKWLKDRKDRELSYEDILHYQKIIVALTETDRLMREIDEVEIE